MHLSTRISRMFFNRYAEPSPARRKKRYPHQVFIRIDRDIPYQGVSDWCEDQLTDRYTVTASYGDLRDGRLEYMARDAALRGAITQGANSDPFFTYWFQNPDDAFAFKMRWG